MNIPKKAIFLFAFDLNNKLSYFKVFKHSHEQDLAQNAFIQLMGRSDISDCRMQTKEVFENNLIASNQIGLEKLEIKK